MKRLLASLLLCLWAALAGAADGLVALPELKARVTDLTGTLTDEQRQTLEARLAAFDAAKGSQIAVLLLPSTQPEAIEQFGIRLAEVWKVGRKGVDDGVIVIVAKDDRRLRIEVGYGLEGALNDATAKRIVSEAMSPRFKQGDYFGGLQAGLEAIVSVIEGEPLPPAAQARGHGDAAAFDGDWPTWIFMTIIFASLARRLLGILGSLGAAGFAGFLAFGAFGLWAAVVAGLVAFLFSFIPLGVLMSARGGGWHSSGSGGGFSGGGGSFGGGGASGGW